MKPIIRSLLMALFLMPSPSIQLSAEGVQDRQTQDKIRIVGKIVDKEEEHDNTPMLMPADYEQTRQKLKEIQIETDNRRREKRSDSTYMRRNLFPLLEHFFEKHKNEIWGKHEGELSFWDFLTPENNRNFARIRYYAIRYLFEDERFSHAGLSQQQQTVNCLLKMLDDDDYAISHSDIGLALIMQCGVPALFTSEAKRTLNHIVRKTLSKDTHEQADLNRLSLLFFMDGNDLEQDLWPLLRKEASLCRVYDMRHRRTVPFLSLVFLAQNGTQDELRQFLGLMHNNGRLMDYDLAMWFIPYVSLLRKKEAVLMLGEYLKQDEIKDLGEDIIARYNGYSCLAASSLYLMIQGFPKVSLRHYSAADREKCLTWLKENESYSFKGKTDWCAEDEIVSRVRFMIWVVRW